MALRPIPRALFYSLSGVCLLIGLRYTFTSRILPYHERYIGENFDELNPKLAHLMMNFLHVAGVEFISLSIMLFLLVRVPLERGERWAWWGILFSMTPIFGLLLGLALGVGGSAPWWLALLLLLMLMSALWTSRPSLSPDKASRSWPTDGPPVRAG